MNTKILVEIIKFFGLFLLRNMSVSNYSEARRRLYKRILSRHRAQYINYEKFYLASDCTKSKGKLFDYATAIFAGLLLYTILQSGGQLQENSSVLYLLSGATAILSVVAVVGDWQSKASEYYNTGQIQQDLYQELDHMVKERLPDPSEADSDLSEACDRLLQRQSEINRTAPHLSQKWYYRVMYRDRWAKWDYERTLEDIEPGVTKFHQKDERQGWRIKLRRKLLWKLI